eukprot:752025-Prymnesium_polylepis.1
MEVLTCRPPTMLCSRDGCPLPAWHTSMCAAQPCGPRVRRAKKAFEAESCTEHTRALRELRCGAATPAARLATGSGAKLQRMADELSAPYTAVVTSRRSAGRRSAREMAARREPDGALPAGLPCDEDDPVGEWLESFGLAHAPSHDASPTPPAPAAHSPRAAQASLVERVKRAARVQRAGLTRPSRPASTHTSPPPARTKRPRASISPAPRGKRRRLVRASLG